MGSFFSHHKIVLSQINFMNINLFFKYPVRLQATVIVFKKRPDIVREWHFDIVCPFLYTLLYMCTL